MLIRLQQNSWLLVARFVRTREYPVPVSLPLSQSKLCYCHAIVTTTARFFDWPVDPVTQVGVLRSKKLAPLLADLLGNDVQCLSMSGRTVPADQASSESYTRWHRDYGRAAVGLHEHGPPMHDTRAPLGIKMFIAVTDHTP
jgi:hypothetical protein